eukprot:161534-Amphidinium_carterae.1
MEIHESTYRVTPVPSRQSQQLLSRLGFLPKRTKCASCGGPVRAYGKFLELDTHHYRCRARGCQTKIHRLHGHPLFVHQNTALSIRTQYALYEGMLRGTPQHQLHQQFNIPHSSVERYADRLRAHVAKYVESVQGNIPIGETPLEEWEVDECTISHFMVKSPTRPKGWSAYVGLVRRGLPSSLLVYPMTVRYTRSRSPGPGPITKKEWASIASYTVENPAHALILHTDSARAYNMKFSKIYHTRVVHQKKKVGYKWVLPTFVKRV